MSTTVHRRPDRLAHRGQGRRKAVEKVACADTPGAACGRRVGYLPVSKDGAVLFLQLINVRHHRVSTVLT